jgi:galactonate dehydratase
MKISEVRIYNITWEYNPKPVIVRLVTDEGLRGLGEVGLAYGAGDRAGTQMVKTLAERFLVGADPSRIEAMWEQMYRKTFWGQGGGPVLYGAMSAIDEALWDIKGQALGVPVYEMLGGCCWDKLRVYANGWSRGNGSPEAYAAGALQVVADGYTAMKFDPFAVNAEGIWDYPHRNLDPIRADLAYKRVKAVREAVGPDIDVLVEVHGNLGPTSAIQVGKRLEELHPFFYEEPVDAMNVECMRKVAENVDIPIAAGERLYTRYGFRPYIEGQILDILQPDIGLTGGITEAKKIATYAETYNLHVQPHNYGGPISTAAGIQLDACIPNFIIQEMFPYHPEAQYRLVKHALELDIRNGYVEPPTKAGLGVELDEAEMEKYPCIRVK